MQRPVGLRVVIVLALVQMLFGAFRAVQWFELGRELIEGGIFMYPLAGRLMMVRGGLIAIIALLYLAFAIGAWARQGWAWWLGLIAAFLNVTITLWLVFDGVQVIPVLISALIALVLVCYLIAPAGRQAFTHRSVAVT
ncbi:hypothetical protein [Nitrospira sp. Nam74]